jgi:type I restriction enzyme S subunit
MSGEIRRFKRYPAYKDSGVEWLGKVPKDWERPRLKRVFRVINGSTPGPKQLS